MASEAIEALRREFCPGCGLREGHGAACPYEGVTANWKICKPGECAALLASREARKQAEHLLADHGPDGHNVTNAQYVNLREKLFQAEVERDRMREAIQDFIDDFERDEIPGDGRYYYDKLKESLTAPPAPEQKPTPLTVCPNCNGTGSAGWERCDECGGTGKPNYGHMEEAPAPEERETPTDAKPIEVKDEEAGK